MYIQKRVNIFGHVMLTFIKLTEHSIRELQTKYCIARHNFSFSLLQKTIINIYVVYFKQEILFTLPVFLCYE